MQFVWYGFAGVLGGLLGGMGMGGGTVLIPLLSIFYGVNQHIAQSTNLITFIPMAIVALIVHIKGKLVDYKWALYLIVPGVFTCVVGCYLARAIDANLLKRFFGGFLIALSIFQMIDQIIKWKKKG